MATKPINVDVYEIRTLIADKCTTLAVYLTTTPPAYIDTGSVGDMVKRIGELNLALKEAVAAIPGNLSNQPPVGASTEGKRAPN